MKNLKIFTFFTSILVICFIFCSCNKKDENLTTVRLNEVTHSIFYAPQYVTIEKGFFEKQGLNIELAAGQGSDKSMTALISNSADIALLGTEAGIYVYNEGKDDFAVPFAQLTQRAGNFLIAREPDNNFNWNNVKGKTIIGGRNGGMPQMILEYILQKNNLVLGEDVSVVTNLDFTSTVGAFSAGNGDFTVEFEPNAYNLEKEEKGYVVASLGVDSGKIPYTVYMSTKSFINENEDTIQKFTNAVYEGQKWVESHSSREIAEVIAPQFKENTIDELEAIVERYKKQDTWKNNPVFDEEGFNLIQDIMDKSGELSNRVSFGDMINTKYAVNAVENIK